MAEEEYELLPHQIVADLKYDLEALKKKLSQPDSKANELILEIESMKDAVHELNVVFEKALQEMKEEDVSKTFQVLLGRLDVVVSQNETIAKGMVAISDKLDDFMGKPGGRMPTAMPGTSTQHTMGTPAPPGRIAPRPEAMFPPTSPVDFPPPPSPAGRKQRVGLFS